MAGYFWAGLLMGLLIWVVAEAVMQLRHPVSRNLREYVVTVVKPQGKVEDLEYCLRRIQADLSGCGFVGCQILLVSDALDLESKQIAERVDGVRLCSERELAAMPIELK